MRLGLQLYTLRDYLKTPAEVATTLASVSKLGYRVVQVSGLGPIPHKDLRKILDDNGLTCCATHGPLDRLEKDLAAVIEEHQILGCELNAIGGYWPTSGSASDWSDFIRRYSAIADTAAQFGLKVGYHNHNHEFARPAGEDTGPVIMQRLIDGCSKNVWMELDTYWVQHGGGDPCQWIRKVAGRIPVVHLKDMAFSSNPKEAFMAEVGEGNLNWPGIIAECRSAGVQWAVVEQDVCKRDPFEAIAISLQNCLVLGLSV